MKRALFRVLALTLAAMVFLSFTGLALTDSKAAPKEALRFNEEGKFRLMMINDTQDTDRVNPRLVKFINSALDAIQPDLVVFVGDNVADAFFGATDAKVEKAISHIIKPLEVRNIPFLVTFGNHDAETGVSNDRQMEMYKAYENCYVDVNINYGDLKDQGPEEGVYSGDYSLPILSSDAGKVAFNIFTMDTHNRDEITRGYDGVYPDQIEWYEGVSQKQKAANGGEAVPSLLFQHISVPEIVKLMKVVPAGTPNARRRGTTWRVLDEELYINGNFGEASYPSETDRKIEQYDSWLEQGNIAGAFFGHDHCNSFMGRTRDGIILGYNGGAAFRSYGDGDKRSVRVFDIDEKDPWNYESHLRTYGELTGERFDLYITDIFSLRWFDLLLEKFIGLFVDFS